MARCGSKDHFLYYGPGILGIFLQVIGQVCRNGLVNCTHHLGIPEFCLRLSLKLGFLHLYRNDSSQSFPEIIPRYIKLHFGQHA